MTKKLLEENPMKKEFVSPLSVIGKSILYIAFYVMASFAYYQKAICDQNLIQEYGSNSDMVDFLLGRHYGGFDAWFEKDSDYRTPNSQPLP